MKIDKCDKENERRYRKLIDMRLEIVFNGIAMNFYNNLFVFFCEGH